MAGKRQHTLPKFLLKGFASKIDGKEIFTWVYRKDRVFEANTTNVGVEKHFYGEPGSSTVDEAITNVEAGYAALLDELRKTIGVVEKDSLPIAEFIAHICIRTKHLRDSFRDLSGYLLENVFEQITDIEKLIPVIINRPQLIREELHRQLADQELPEVFKDLLIHLVQSMGAEELRSQKEYYESMVNSISSEMLAIIPQAVKDGHVGTLEKDLSPEFRVNRYASLKWSVFQADVPLILGDMGCLFQTMAEPEFKSIDDKDDNLKSIYLPISAGRLLVGSACDVSVDIDIDYINEAAAKCSKDFFVSSAPTRQHLQAIIGTGTSIIGKNDLDEIVKDVQNAVRLENND